MKHLRLLFLSFLGLSTISTITTKLHGKGPTFYEYIYVYSFARQSWETVTHRTELSSPSMAQQDVIGHSQFNQNRNYFPALYDYIKKEINAGNVNGMFINTPYAELMARDSKYCYLLGLLLNRGNSEDLDTLIAITKEHNNTSGQLLIQHLQRKHIEAADQAVQNVFKQYFVIRQLKQQQEKQ